MSEQQEQTQEQTTETQESKPAPVNVVVHAPFLEAYIDFGVKE